MTIYDISQPHDLRVRLNKPSMTTDEIDAALGDPAVDEELKRQLRADVEPQGYRLREASEYEPTGYVRAVLEVLLEEGGLTQAGVDEAIGVDQVDIAAVLAEAEEQGLIERVAGSSVIPRWQITDEGRKAIGKHAR
jgi:DNA-binding MarR family transcriptional regulator